MVIASSATGADMRLTWSAHGEELSHEEYIRRCFPTHTLLMH